MATELHPNEIAVQSADASHWPIRVVVAPAVVLAVSMVLPLLLPFLLRWWSFRVDSLSDGSFSRGILVGVLIGAVAMF
ncbi:MULTISPECIES: hypothetical protein [Nocardia]|uniref:hypothetical protein n=1 Tax=Nocardia TaxID=1817 RepID=UPI00245596A5|nr:MULTISPECIES: hypothetical protein [Nocardia]